VSIFRGLDESDSGPSKLDASVGHQELRPARSLQTLAVGTLACARCDAPVALERKRMSPSDLLSCPFCLHHGAVRDFLTLGEPTRPARVVVRIALAPARAPAR
jgi:hypothetical protein